MKTIIYSISYFFYMDNKAPYLLNSAYDFSKCNFYNSASCYFYSKI